MIRTLIAASLILLAVATRAGAQDFKVEKYQLANGLTVILHEDRSLPVATINLWYRVGARNEPPGRSGFAHLYEHLMFMGTKRVPGNDFDVLMEVGGGSNNASTSLDRTNYFSSGPATLLPTLLWLDADRLEDMGAHMDQGKLDKQRDIVRNEIRQNVENTPYGRAYEYSYKYLYPPSHPYNKGVYGTHEDLEAASVLDVKDFFASFYTPGNCSLVVAGDFDSAQIKPLVERLFGSIPRGNAAPQTALPPASLDRVVRITMLDKVQLPKIAMSFHSPGSYADGDAEASLIASLLAGGKSSRLERRLVEKDQTCVEVSAFQDGAALGSVLRVEVLTKPGADLNAVERAIDEELALLADKGPTAEELKQRQAVTEAGFLAALQRIGTRADRMNEYEYFWGEPNSFARDLKRYTAATPQGVRDWARRILTPQARLVIHVLPESPEREPSPRDQRPGPMAAGDFKPAQPASFALSNGVKVLVWNRPELPLAAMNVVIRPSEGVLESPARAGLSALTASMLEEGAGELDGAAFAAAMESLGGSFGVGADRESIGAGMSIIARNFEKGAALLADALLRPRFAEDDFSRVKALALDGLRQEDEDPPAVAGRVSQRMLFGADHPYGRPVQGDVETVEPLTLSAIKEHWAGLARPGNTTILIAGAITPEQARAVLEKTLGSWKASGPDRAPIKASGAPAADQGLRVYIVDRPGAVQTMVRYLLPSVTVRDESRVALHVLNVALGGSFTSRLNANLREKNGYTYGARSGFSLGNSAGVMSAGAAVKAEQTGPALKEFMHELGRTRQGDLTADEATKAVQTYRANRIESFASLSGLLAVYGDLVEAGLPLETFARDMAAAAKLDAASLNSAARSAIPLERGVLVLVGDRKLIEEQIKPLAAEHGWKPVVVGPRGE